jgi:beta-N-acetylhexosaminidase
LSVSPSSLGRQIGQLLIAGFGGEQIPAELKAIAREFSLGGVILFGRNIVDAEQVAEMSHDAQHLVAGWPPWITVDQEGGRVARLGAPFTEWPPMAALGRSGDESLAERFARALAAELRAVGITLDFAPVLDVYTNPANRVIGDRALGERAHDVARLGRAIIRGLQGEGVAACGKHFPGHGDTTADSHHELPVVEHPLERLREVELVPFKEAINAEVAAIMTAHVLVPALDERSPATLSKPMLTGLLREELGYEGIIFSDDLEMKALAAEHDIPAAAVRAIAAGCDGVLVCSDRYDTQAATLEALVHAAEDESLPLSRIEDALRRQWRAKERYLAATAAARPLPARALKQVLGRDEHRAVADEMARFA